jgi:DNA-binding protein HU-beta
VNKADLIADIADKTGEPKQKVAEIVDAVFDTIAGALQKETEVRIPNFGVFLVAQTAPRKARNPQTGEEVKVPAGRRARFRPGKALKDALEAITTPLAPKR